MEDKEQRYKQILTMHWDMIYRLCCSYIEDSDLRKDLFQNILIRIWKGLNAFENRSSVGTWVYRIAVNASIDFFRKEEHIRYIELTDIDITDHSANVEADLIQSEKMKLMYHCINKLTFIDKTIITLYLEDISHRDISEIVGISEKNVSVKLTRIKKKLNNCLKDY
jgi:RNA polymerase sigma-70 factor (ECF subfamily)